MSEVRVAFIGAGNLANRYHYPSVAEIPQARMVAICDLDEERLNRTADKYGIQSRYTDYHKMLEREEIDAVYGIMPPHPLKGIVLDCFDAGKHVFMEKPPGLNTEETIEMAEAAERNKCISLVGLNRRYAAVMAAASEAACEDREVTMVMAEFHKDMTGPYWDMSILHTDIIHVVDCLRSLADGSMGGEVIDVYAHAECHHRQWENSFNLYNALLRFDNGASGILSANRTSGNRYERFEVHADGVSCYIRAPEVLEIYRAGEKEPEIITGESLTGSTDPRKTYGYYDESVHFIECIETEADTLTCLEDAVKTMQACDMIAACGS